MKALVRLPPNTEGRDFVCGDIHGSYTCVERALSELNFDKAKDRLICAGDLIDRGPLNERCMEFLYEPWFHMCMGNHEHMMLEYFLRLPYGEFWARNGGSWGTKYAKWAEFWRQQVMTDTEEFVKMEEWVKETVLSKVQDLPYLITVERPNGGIYHVLHAELPWEKKLSDEDLADEERLMDAATVQTIDGDTIIWGRFMFLNSYKKIIDDVQERKIRTFSQMHKIDRYFENLSPIFSGHTIVRQPLMLFGQINLDTMAYGSYGSPGGYGYAPKPPEDWCGLTVTEPETGRFWLVNDREFKETQPVVIS